MRYRLHTLLMFLAIGLPMLPASAQTAPLPEKSQRDQIASYYHQLLLQGVHPIEAQMRDELLYARLSWDRPQQAFRKFDELEKELNAIQTDVADERQVIVRARKLLAEERISLEAYSTPLDVFEKRLDDNPSDAAALSKYVRKAKDLYAHRGNARATADAIQRLAEIRARLTKWEQQVTDQESGKNYSTAKADLARIERALVASVDSKDRK